MRLLLYIMALLVAMSSIAQNLPAPASKDKPVFDEKAGQSTYEQYCAVCHEDGVAGAPKFRDEKSWKPRLANRDLDALIASANKGLNAMPQKGTCTTCTDDDLKNAIHYMLPPS